MAQRYGTFNKDYAHEMGATEPDADGPICMVNLMKFRDMADYSDGRETTLSGREADDLYAPLEILADVGAEIVFVAVVEEQTAGSPAWDRVVVVNYPTRRSFIDMIARPDYQERHVHKDAGMEHTIIAGCVPASNDGMSLLTVEGMIVGDGRAWSEVELTAMSEKVSVTTRDLDSGDLETSLLVRPALNKL